MELAPSLMVFEINKKILLYKLLSPSFAAILNAEISKNYGSNENDPGSNQQASEESPECPEESPENILYYQYFAPIINSYEISRDLSFVYEYILFERRQHVIRFYLYKNCLVLSIYDTRQTVPAVGQINSLTTRLVHAEYYSSWYSKSFVSLMKYKFGICDDEKCFATQTMEFNRLYSNWSNLFIKDQNYFVEAIEQLEVNEDLKLKCDNFIRDFVEFLENTESVMGELDYIEENILKLPDEDNFAFQFQSTDGELQNPQKMFKFTQLENFFTDLKLIDQFVLSYGNKLLHKFKIKPSSLKSSNPPGQIETNRSNFSLDSPSLFMLLLEATDFIEYKAVVKSDAEILNEEIYESANSSPVSFKPRSSFHMPKKGNQELREPSPPADFTPNETYSTPLIQYFDNLKTQNTESLPDSSSTDSSASKLSFTKIKKTHGFLYDNNKSLGFYDLLFLKLDKNFCMTMVKSNRLNRYCHLMSEFDRLAERFLELLSRKRIEMNDDEMNNSNLNEDGLKMPSRASPSPSVRRNSIERAGDSKADKAFLSFFVNKIIIFYDKLSSLKADLKAASKKSHSDSERSAFGFSSGNRKRASSTKSSHRTSENSMGYRTSYNQNQRRNSSSSNDFTMLQYRLRKVESLQLKINRLTNGKEFKHLFGFINNQNSKNLVPDQPSLSKNETFSYLRMIDTQMSSIRLFLNELFYELFLANTFSLGHQTLDSVIQLRNSPTTPTNSENPNDINNIVFKSAHVIENLQNLYKKHLYHYIPFMDLKLYRNITISYYWHQFPGLIHFSFINRHNNMSIIPTIDAYQSPYISVTDQAINTMYKKYVPIVQALLYKQNCTQIQFVDDKLKLVFSYFIWFEDIKSNYIPVDFMNSATTQPQELSKNYDSLLNSQSDLKTQPPGITMQQNFYEILPKFCYPYAPDNSLVCFELYCIHSPSLSDLSIKNQLNLLKQNLTKKSRAS